MHTIPLPSLTPVLAQQTAHDATSLYPINILSRLHQVLENELERMVLTCPVHVHTPQAHIGTIHGSYPGQDFNARDLFRYLQTLAQRPLDFHTTYSRLSQQMKVEVEAAFMLRNGQSMSTVNTWELFTSGQPALGGPTGEDLLLGNLDIWGMQDQSLSGYSIVHLA